MTDPKALDVLVIDDDPVSMLVAQHVLSTHGHSVATASSAAEARTVIIESPDKFDVLVCDYLMPDATGLDLLTQLDELKIWIPMLLLTGVSNEAELGDERSAKVAGFLTKPVQSNDLLSAVAALATVDRGSVSPR